MPTPTDEHLEGRLVRLTRDLVLIESTDSRPDERARCFQLIKNHLEGLERVRLIDHHCEEYQLTRSCLMTGLEVIKPSIRSI